MNTPSEASAELVRLLSRLEKPVGGGIVERMTAGINAGNECIDFIRKHADLLTSLLSSHGGGGEAVGEVLGYGSITGDVRVRLARGLAAGTKLYTAPPPQPRAEGMVLPPDTGPFADWLAREMPPGTVISNPAWWAPRILRQIARLAAAPGEGIEQRAVPFDHKKSPPGYTPDTFGSATTPPPASQSAERVIGDIADECMKPDGVCETCRQPLHASQSATPSDGPDFALIARMLEDYKACARWGYTAEAIAEQISLLEAADNTHEARTVNRNSDTERLDYIERTFSGMTNRERYLPVQMIWGNGANGRTLREACDKYMKRDAGGAR